MADRFQSLMSLLGNDVSVRWLITLLHFLWQGAVVGGLIVIAGKLLRGASARPKYALYSASLLSLPVCVAVTFCVVDVPVSLRSSSQAESPAGVPFKSPSLQSQATTMVATDATELDPSVVRNVAAMKAVAGGNLPSASHSTPAMLSRAAPWIAAVYVVSVACFLLRLASALWGGYRLQTQTSRVTDAKLLRLIADQTHRMKMKCVPVVAYCERVAVPTVLGMLRPMVLLPVPLMTGLTPDEFTAIIRHKLAHIRRYDLWMNLLQRVIESLLFFHPVVWFISRRLNAEREVCCDDLVVSSGYEPMHYAGALLRMAELCAISRQSGALALAASGDKAPLLEKRIERLMNWGNTPRLQLTRAGMAILLMTLVSLIVIPGIAHSWAQAQARAATPEVQATDAPATATEMRPKHEAGQTLFKQWQGYARTDGKIPGALIGKLGENVRWEIAHNKGSGQAGHDRTAKLENLLPRFDATLDWSPSDAIALIDDLTAIDTNPLGAMSFAAEENMIRTGRPLPAELADAPWGRPSPDGLRVAWLLEPRAKEYPLGTSLKSRIFVHNSGKKTAIFSMLSWLQGGGNAHDVKGAVINVTTIMWLPFVTRTIYRLAPGEYCETPAASVGVGANTESKDRADVRVGAWIETKPGDEVCFSPCDVPLLSGAADGADFWLRIVAERIGRELPLPVAAAEREQIIRRVMLDLCGQPPTPEEIAAFIADDAATAQAMLQKRLADRPNIAPFSGMQTPGDIQFRVLAAETIPGKTESQPDLPPESPAVTENPVKPTEDKLAVPDQGPAFESPQLLYLTWQKDGIHSTGKPIPHTLWDMDGKTLDDQMSDDILNKVGSFSVAWRREGELHPLALVFGS